MTYMYVIVNTRKYLLMKIFQHFARSGDVPMIHLHQLWNLVILDQQQMSQNMR